MENKEARAAENIMEELCFYFDGWEEGYLFIPHKHADMIDRITEIIKGIR